jgi:hypothetical protein
MRYISAIVLLAYPLFVHSAIFGTARTWDFMQSVGGIALDTPVARGGRWSLPLRCDVSGLTAVTVKPTLVNSALVWADTRAQVTDHDILITIETGPIRLSGETTACGDAELGKVKKGKYTVYYRDPDGSRHLLGRVDLEF